MSMIPTKDDEIEHLQWQVQRLKAELEELRRRVPDAPERLAQRLNIALGLIAPGGTAPCDALHRLYRACEAGDDPRPALGALHKMLESHYGDWDAIENPTSYPDPGSDEYASGLSLLEGLRRYQRFAGQEAG